MSRTKTRNKFLSPVWNCLVLFILILCPYVAWSQEKEGGKQCDVKDNHCDGGKCEKDSACHGPYFGYHCVYYNACGKKAAEIRRLDNLEIIIVTFPLAIVESIHMTTLNDSDLSDAILSFKRKPTDEETTCDGDKEQKSAKYIVYHCNKTMESSRLFIRNVPANLVLTITVNEDSKWHNRKEIIYRAQDTDITSVHFSLSRVRLVQITLTNSTILQDLPIIILKKTPQDKAATCNGFAVQTSQKYIEYHCRQLLEASILIITQMKASLVETVAISEGRNILPRQSYLQHLVDSATPKHQIAGCKSGENLVTHSGSIIVFVEPVVINSWTYLDKNEEEVKVTNVTINTYNVECNLVWAHKTTGNDFKVLNGNETVAVKYLKLYDVKSTRESTCELLVLGDCPIGWYGVYCNFTCSERCLDGRCTVEGFCLGCFNDTFVGLQCCSKYCKDDVCTYNGTCIRGCKPGREGIDCSQEKIIQICKCPTGNCDENGQCDGGETCRKGYFGLSCQYLDGTTMEWSSENKFLHDNNDKTCNDINKKMLLIKTQTLRISFVRLVYEGSLNFGDIEFLFIDRSKVMVSCLGENVAIAENILEHHCHDIVTISGVVVNILNVARLCDVYVSMGRTILFEDSKKNITDKWSIDKRFLKSGNCSIKAVDDISVFLEIEHASPVAIDWFHLRNITDSRILQKKVLIIHAIFATATNIVIKCTNPTNITDKFEAEHCIPAGEEESLFPDGPNAENKGCTLEAHGACDTGKFGFQCESYCSETCRNQKCTLEGYCVGCSNTRFTGNLCNETLPEECPMGKHGNVCQYQCRKGCQKCQRIGAECVECEDQNMAPPSCNVTIRASPRIDCPVGKYGAQCELQCSTTCKDKKCTYAGHCIACTSELYYGVQCEKKRTVNSSCPEGKYGDDCQKSCSGLCKKCTVTGLCEGCRFENYHGSNCSILITACSPYCANDGSCYADLACVFGCKSGFHGPQCTHLGLASEYNLQKMWTCHCHDFECDHPFDRCPQFSTCIQGWFGYLCDYRDLAIWSNVSSPLLTDGSNKTCFLAPNNTVTAQWRNPILFSWLWLTFEDSANVGNFTMTITKGNLTLYLSESVLDVTAIQSNLIEIFYLSSVWLTSMVVSWKGVGQVCTLSVSGGQSLALGLPTVSYSKSKQHLKDQLVKLTDGDVFFSNCVSGHFAREFGVNFHFTHPIFISRMEIFPDYRMEEDDTVVIKMWDSASYLGKITSQKVEQQIYTSISFKFIEDITSVHVSLVEGKMNICEIQIFGDCMPPRHGFFCKHECSMTCRGDACFYDGTCLTCIQGRQGPYCIDYLVQVTPERNYTQKSDETLIAGSGKHVRKGLFLVNIGMLIITNIRLFMELFL